MSLSLIAMDVEQVGGLHIAKGFGGSKRYEKPNNHMDYETWAPYACGFHDLEPYGYSWEEAQEYEYEVGPYRPGSWARWSASFLSFEL